jgi:hypothetical protein
VNFALIHLHNFRLPVHLRKVMLGCTLQRPDGIVMKNLRLSKHTDMTIHWKAFEEHFLMVPLVFLGKIHFLNFSQKISVLIRVKCFPHNSNFR